MSAQNRPISKVSNKNFNDNFDRIFNKKEVPIGEDTRPKDRTKLGISPTTTVEEWDCRVKVEKSAESLKTLDYSGSRVEPIMEDE